jgi:hypothetical protein
VVLKLVGDMLILLLNCACYDDQAVEGWLVKGLIYLQTHDGINNSDVSSLADSQSYEVHLAVLS